MWSPSCLQLGTDITTFGLRSRRRRNGYSLRGFPTKRGRTNIPPPWLVCIVRTWLISESDLPPDPTLSTTPEERADNRVCILPLSCIAKAAYRGAQAFDRLVPNPERFRQSVFQDYSLRIECVLRRW